MKGSIIMNKELNNAIKNNEKVYAENVKVTDNCIKTLNDVNKYVEQIKNHH